jgi:DNA-directed RNA polymerase specialized sigma subunit
MASTTTTTKPTQEATAQLRAVARLAAKLAKLEQQATDARTQRDQLIAGLARGGELPQRAIAEAAGVTRQMVQQIRDRG